VDKLGAATGGAWRYSRTATIAGRMNRKLIAAAGQGDERRWLRRQMFKRRKGRHDGAVLLYEAARKSGGADRRRRDERGDIRTGKCGVNCWIFFL
jgi:hypothetical protein